VAGYDRGTDVKGSQHKCHRSAWAWPRLIGVTRDHHLACSGAVINNIPEYGENGTPQNNTTPDDVVQITRLKRISASEAISRVLLTLGGNDKPVNFASRLGTCWAIGPVGCVRDIDKIVSDMGGLRTRLANTYRNIQRASGGAPLLVVGYPDLFPDPSAKRTSVHCPWINRAALRRLDRLEASLDSTLSHAARDAGVDYLSMRDVLKGHELCTGKSWLRAIVGKPGDVSPDQQQGHPLKEGQAAIAKRVREWLTEHASERTYFYNNRQGWLVRPRTLDFCSTGCEYDGLSWRGWDTRIATGKGFFAPKTSDPSVNGRWPVVIKLSRRRRCPNHRLIYTRYEETLTGKLPPWNPPRVSRMNWGCDGYPPGTAP
jgi:hypothetical protein